METVRLVLVRHGFSEGNAAKRLAGWTDVALSEKGAEELYRLKEEYVYPETEKYYSSDLTRCIQTFQILFGDKHSLDELLPQFRETHFGVLENISHEETVARRFWHNWIMGKPVEDEEKYTDFCLRIKTAFYELLRACIQNSIRSATLVCHEGVIRIILSVLKNTGPESFFKSAVPNGLGYEVVVCCDESEIRLKNCQPIRAHEGVAC